MHGEHIAGLGKLLHPVVDALDQPFDAGLATDAPVQACRFWRGDVLFNGDWMAVSSYGSSTKSSGVVRILKDLDADLSGRHVLIVEDILDSGLTLSWLLRNLRSRGAASVEVLTLLRKPDAMRTEVDVRYLGFDIPNDFVVGYGLDYAEKYRNLDCVAKLSPSVYEGHA